MPVFEILDEKDRPLRDAGLRVAAVMFHPCDDAEQRNTVVAVGQLEALSREGHHVPPIIAARALDQGSEGILRHAKKAAVKGYIAGDTLLYLVRLARHAPTHASVRQAWHMVERRRAIARDGEGRRLPASSTSIQTAWGNHRSVSPLWAAWIVLGEDETALNAPNLPKFLAGARWFGDFAATHRPRSGVSANAPPVLDRPEIWTVPTKMALPSCSYDAPTLTEAEWRWLNEYRHE